MTCFKQIKLTHGIIIGYKKCAHNKQIDKQDETCRPSNMYKIVHPDDRKNTVK